MATATMTSLDAILKEVYGPRIESQLQDETVARKRIERTSDGVVETVGGKYVDFPIHVTRNTGLSWRREEEQIAPAGRQGYAEVHVPLQYGYGRCKITGQVMELADTNVQAFASGLDQEMTRLKDDITKDENRITYGDGTGLLASVTADGVNTVTVDNIQWLEVGMVIDIRTRSNGAAVGANKMITAINETTKVVTYTNADGTAGDVVAAATDGLYREGNFAGGTKREPSGFGNIIDNASVLHGLDPAVQPKWAATVHANGGTFRALSEGLMIALCDAVRTKGGKTSAIFTSLGVRRAYFNLLTQQRRYTDTKSYAGGFQGLPFNYGTEIPVVEDVDAPPNRMEFVDEDKIKIFRNKEWHWADKDGSVLKWVHDYDIWEGLLKSYYEFGTTRRNAHGSLRDITEG